MNKKLWIPILILMFILGGIFAYSFFPRLNKSQPYNEHVQEMINFCKASLMKDGFSVRESKILDYSYFGIKDFSLFKSFAGYQQSRVIGLEVDNTGVYLHARFWYKSDKTYIVYEVI